jgi:phage/plasmid primase-like uncharacterized protein
MAGPHYDVTAEIDGRIYRGKWTLKQGGLICVSWGDGAKTVELGRARPEIRADKTLRELVTKRLAQRAREEQAREARRRRLSPNA